MKLLSAMMTSILLLAVSFTLQAELVVIAHPSVSDNLDRKEISRIYLGKSKKFPNGKSVLPINLPEGNASRNAFNSNVLKKSADQMKSYWAKQVFTGKGRPPREESSAKEVIDLVKDNPSIIGYIDASAVTGDVKVLGKF